MTFGTERAVALVILLAAGIGSLPMSAYLFDAQGSENWIFPAQLLVMALLGAVVGRVLPRLAGPRPSSRRAMIVGAATGVAMAVAGSLVFFLLLSGFHGA